MISSNSPLIAFLRGYSTMLRRPGARQAHDEDAALVPFGGERQRAAVGLDDALADRQPQAMAAGGARAGLVDAKETLEDVGLVFRRNAAAGVRDGKHGVVAIVSQTQLDASAG